ncbi:MAG: leucine-rich repeat domain-containing protein [Thermoguttaceae bacterium]|nr:leucine-rich repeat domain-containing protein [Thermoguttaceae bacterium]
MTSVEIPNSVKEIGDYAFIRCASLTSVEIPNSVKEIAEGAFFGNSSLISVEIPNSVKEIGKRAFAWRQSLTSVEIPNSVEKIAGDAFNNCSSSTSFAVSANHPHFKTVDGVLFTADGKTLIAFSSPIKKRRATKFRTASKKSAKARLSLAPTT